MKTEELIKLKLKRLMLDAHDEDIEEDLDTIYCWIDVLRWVLRD